MRLCIFVLISAVFFVACNPAAEPAAQAETRLAEQGAPINESTAVEEPMPAKRPHEMTLHGHTRIDEYFWLRDDTRKDPEVIAYLEEENAYFDKIMKPVVAMQETIYEEMMKNMIAAKLCGKPQTSIGGLTQRIRRIW